LTCAGCSRFDTIDECRRVAKLVNPALTEVAALTERPSTTAATYEKIAIRYITLAKVLETVKTPDPRLSPLVEELRQLYEVASKSAHGYAEALDRKDPNRLSATRTIALQQLKRERSLNRRFLSTCSHD
jgi:hypothetical protein